MSRAAPGGAALFSILQGLQNEKSLRGAHAKSAANAAAIKGASLLKNRLPGNVLVALVYFAAGKLGLIIGAEANILTPIWPADGLALAALLIFGQWLWPGILTAAFAITYVATDALLPSVVIACGNIGQVALAAFILRRVHFDRSLSSLKDVMKLLGVGAVACPTIGTTIGVLTAWFSSIETPFGFTKTWIAWWIGAAFGSILVTPFFLVWSERLSFKNLREYFPNSSRRIGETGVVALLLVVVSLIVFSTDPGAKSQYLHTYAVFPFLLWATFRFGQIGATASIFLIAVIATWGTATGRGPFVRDDLTESLFILQTFTGTAAITFLSFGALLTETRKALSDLQRAIADREDIVAIVSHDLKSPLGAVLLNANLLSRMVAFGRTSASDFRMPAERIVRSVEQMKGLIDHILDVRKIEAGTLSVEPMPNDVQQLLAEAMDTLMPLAQAKSIRISLDSKIDNEKLYSDRSRVLQVLYNLVGNAIKFTPPNGWVRILVNKRGSVATFSVIDNGPGIPEEQLSHIFDRYWQAKRSSKHGTGLGLFIAKGIVEAHGGKIWAESKVGLGTTIHFTLPICISIESGSPLESKPYAG